MTNNENQFNKDAINFLKKHNATIKIDFIEYNYYFLEDEEKRNIYKFTIRRNGKQYSHKFGDSIHNTKEGKRPNEYDILATIQKYDVFGDVWDFASECGYTIDSKEEYNKINRIYNDCKKEYMAIERLFGDCMDELREID